MSFSRISVTMALFHAWKVESLATHGVPLEGHDTTCRVPEHAVDTLSASSSEKKGVRTGKYYKMIL